MPDDSGNNFKLSLKQWGLIFGMLAALNGGGSFVSAKIFGSDNLTKQEYRNITYADSLKTAYENVLKKDLLDQILETVKEVKSNLKKFMKKSHFEYREAGEEEE